MVAILVPAVGNFGSKAKERAVRADLRTLKAAVEMYKVENGSFPAQATWEADLQGETDRIVDRVPDDPYSSPAAQYIYKLSTAGRHTYVVYSVGPGATGNITPGDDQITVTAGTPLYVTNAKDIL